MRTTTAVLVAILVALPLLLSRTAALAQEDLPPGAESLLVCATVYSLHAGDLMGEGDEAGAEEFSHLSEALAVQAAATLEAFGYTDEQIEEIGWSFSMTTGFNYGAGDAERLLGDCLSSMDTP